MHFKWYLFAKKDEEIFSLSSVMNYQLSQKFKKKALVRNSHSTFVHTLKGTCSIEYQKVKIVVKFLNHLGMILNWDSLQ